MATDSFNLQILHGTSGIENLKADWEVAFSSMSPRGFYHTYEWWSCCIRHLFADPDDMLICRISSPELGCQAIIPLEKTTVRRFGIELIALRIPSHPHLPLRDIVVSGNWPGEFPASWFIRALEAQLPFRWCYLFFDRAVTRSNVLKTFRPSGGANVVVVHTEFSSYIPLDETDPLDSLSKNFRSNLSRSRNKLARLRSVEIEHMDAASEPDAFFDDFLRVEAAGWKGDRGTRSAIKFEQSLVDFYRCLLRNSSLDMQCEISILKADSAPIAVQFGMVTDNTIYQLKIGYDEAYSAMSPGNMLMENLLSEYRRRGLRCFNLVSHARWHRNWRAARDNLYSCYVFNNTLAGWLLYVLLRIKRIVAPIYNRTVRRSLAWVRFQFQGKPSKRH